MGGGHKITAEVAYAVQSNTSQVSSDEEATDVASH